jgi:hypothetical protein
MEICLKIYTGKLARLLLPLTDQSDLTELPIESEEYQDSESTRRVTRSVSKQEQRSLPVDNQDIDLEYETVLKTLETTRTLLRGLVLHGKNTR